MLTLAHLPPPPPIDKVSACENDGQLRSFSPHKATAAAIQVLGSDYIDVVLSQESARPAYSKYEAKDAFFSHTETLSQRLLSTYYEEGIIATIRKMETEEQIHPFIRSFAFYFMAFTDYICRLKNYLPLWPKDSRTISSSADVSFYGNSGHIVSISWHPHCSTLAAVFADDTVRIYGKGRNLIPLLKHRLQRNIVRAEWMSYSASILAVGCESGILLWTLDPISVVTRPSGSCLSCLSHPGALPTSSLSWHPKGLILSCVGGGGKELVVWDVGKEDSVTVYYGIASSFNYLLWSPDGHRLLAATASATLKVFESRKWSFEHWSLEYPVQSAVWSHCGRLLLFVTQQEPFLFCLSFSNEDRTVGGSQMAMRVADLSAIVVQCEDGEEVRVGGTVQQLAWDPRSERLAVLFQESELIALFHTQTSPQLQLVPGGFIRGELGQVPLHISFQRNVTNGSVLTAVWSGGAVKHLPLYYTSREAVNVSVNQSVRNDGPHGFSVYASPTVAANQTRLHSLSPGLSSPLTSPVARLFTSPS